MTHAAKPGTPSRPSASNPSPTIPGSEKSLHKLGDVHAVLVLDQAGWHGSRQLRVPDNVTLVPLPPYAPELNPVERVWLHLRERFLSHRLLNSNAAIVDACCQAWNALTPERLQSLTNYPWIRKVTS
ncbi:hypothetical protein EAH89_29005 [Roseomonas nepalensis]|uniref:Tc1-like transposase DDE domain-containing protein n=1 Tax=Muricoccus nepalensis TaxID=1854500 RepID=A0A502EQ54_9PROT|nr:hypothetical protein EAH89_29005 [Roseomonas nepalensis]